MEKRKLPSAKQEQSQKNLLSQELRALKGAEIVPMKSPALEKKGRELFRINIPTDEESRKQWESKENVKLLYKYFGQAIAQAFGPRDSAKEFDLKAKESTSVRAEIRDNLRDGDFGGADSIYVVAEEGKPIAFLAGHKMDIPGEINGYMVDLIFTRPDKRGHDLCEGLYKHVFAQKFDAVFSCSTTPAAVIEQMRAGAKDYENFYCGYRNGNLKDRGTDKEQEMVRKISRMILEFYADTDSTIPLEEMPPDHLVIKQENGPIPPIEAKNIKFKPGHPLYEIYHKEVLRIQKKFKPHTIYSLLVSLHKDKI